MTPQAPQLALSVLVVTQLVPHGVSPTAHMVTHWPWLQTRPAAQGLLQAPQWVASLCVRVQTPLQFISPAGQAQRPATQDEPPRQMLLQAPQCSSSLLRSTQAPLHADRGCVHEVAQVPALHT
jgi:hypothetical protein